VINKMLFLMEIKFIVARNAAKGFIPAEYSEAMVSLLGGDCLPTKRRGTKSRQQRDENIKCEPLSEEKTKKGSSLLLTLALFFDGAGEYGTLVKYGHLT
jgi:hypothetical protein